MPHHLRSLRLAIPWLVVLGAACPRGGAGGETTTSATDPAIRASDLVRRVAVLASEEFEGRETATDGERRAAAYVAAEMERAGLAPGGTEGWLQPFPVERPRLGARNTLTVAHDDAVRTWRVEKDWNPASVSPGANAEGDLVFAGYGITAADPVWRDGDGVEQRGWDDYAALDVRGKIVLVLRRDPGLGDVRQAALVAKLENAAARGAAALLLVNDTTSAPEGRDPVVHWSAPLGAPLGSGAIPFAFVSRDLAADLLADLDDLGSLEQALRAHGPRPVAVGGVRVRLETSIGRDEAARAVNVVGRLRGTDAAVADEVVVVGAHLDHIGRGRFGSLGGAAGHDRVHPGADDNASGTAALLELAEHFAARESRTRRSLLFVAFSGEELGLLGSRHWVEHPTVPLGQLVCMVNLDMVGRSRGQLFVGGVATGQGLEAIVREANQGEDLALHVGPSGLAPTDSSSFFRKRVPVLFFFTGMHADYHRPSDTADRIEAEGLEKVARVARDTVRALADAPARLAYTEPPAPTRPPVLGIEPAPGPEDRGVPVAGVLPEGPAARAGVAPGDIVVGLAGHVVRTLADLAQVLARLEAGKAVVLEVLRGEERLSLEIVPAPQPGR